MGKNTILVFCAHSDDQVFGPGGTLAKYAKEGKTIYTVIFSYGEGSHPHFKKDIIVKTRMKEAIKADKIIGGKSVEFFGLPDNKKFKSEFDNRNLHEKLKEMVVEYAPAKIFTHSDTDTHHHHRLVNEMVLRAVDDLKQKIPVYTFDVWNFFGVRRYNTPKLVIDISDTFKTKMSALRVFKSQLKPLNYMIGNNFLYLQVYINDFIEGLIYRKRFAEVFYKVR
ncbi:MAG: PIG-L family deacetylase [archaeon]